MMDRYDRDELVTAITILYQALDMIARVRNHSSWVTLPPSLDVDVSNGIDALYRLETTLRRKLREDI